jgi:rfaE bifunctional protein kinase chain/domain
MEQNQMEFGITERYKHKIKTANELRAILGEPPREDKVIMCHGVFDVVHPGHVRHLLYAKSKAPILIASLTADQHINKGEYRPHIPQDLRAINLAAFEFVDYVLIDAFATPLENLKIIKPDIFAKGYEYAASNEVSQKTENEIEVVRSYGGEIVFTPGDVVYSSTSLLNLSPPSLKVEKLMMLLSRHNLTFADLYQSIDGFVGKKVHVVGDTIVDSYTNCVMIGGQTKTPTISVQFESKTDILGGAGIVAEHLKSAGAEVTFSSVIGDDDLGKFVQNKLQSSGIINEIIIDKNRPTVNKNAIVVGTYRLLKVDTLDNSSISDEVLGDLTANIANIDCDALIFSDFRHGIFNRRTINKIIAAIPDRVFKVADSQVASRWGNILDFKGFDLITPNEREARFSLADQDSGIRALASRLYDECQTKLLILKLSDRGILTCLGSNHELLDSFAVMDSFVNRLVDPVGAGDALLAYATLSMITTKNPIVASIIGNLAAACECEHDGNVPITPEELRSKLKSIEDQIANGL